MVTSFKTVATMSPVINPTTPPNAAVTSSTFPLPKSLCSELTSMNLNSWVGERTVEAVR